MNTNSWKDIDKINFKKKLKEYCLNYIQENIDEAKKSMERAQEAANDEEKNSMGEKYEISKVMGQIDSDRAGFQLLEAKKQISLMKLVSVESLYDEAQQGAFIRCDEFNYFIATSIGGKVIDGEKIHIISPNAPVALQLRHKKAGDFIEINKKKITIREIF